MPPSQVKSLVSNLQSASQSSRYPSVAAADAIEMSSQQKKSTRRQKNLQLFYGKEGAKQTKFNQSEIKFEARKLKVEQQANTL